MPLVEVHVHTYLIVYNYSSYRYRKDRWDKCTVASYVIDLSLH